MRKPADWKRTSDPYALWLKELAEAELKGIHERIEKAPPIGLLPDGTSVRIMHSKQVPATPRRQPPAVRCYMRSTCALRPSRCDTGNETVLSLSYRTRDPGRTRSAEKISGRRSCAVVIRSPAH